MTEAIKVKRKKFLPSLTAVVLAMSYAVTPISALAETKEDNKGTGSGESCIEGGTIKLSATDEENKPMSDITYQLRDKDGQVIEEKTTLGNGSIYFTVKGTEKYTVTSSNTDEKLEDSKLNQEVQLKAGLYEQQDFEFTEQYSVVKRDVKITVRNIFDETIEGHEGVDFTLKSTDGKTVQEGKTNDKGVFEVEKVPYGDYFLEMGKYTPKEAEFKLYEQGNSEVIKSYKKKIEIRKTDENYEYNLEARPHLVGYTVSVTTIDKNGTKKALNEGYEIKLTNTTTGKEVTKNASEVGSDNVLRFDKLKYGKYSAELIVTNPEYKDYVLTSLGASNVTSTTNPKAFNINEDSNSVSDSYYLRNDQRKLSITPKIKTQDSSVVGVKDGEKVFTDDVTYLQIPDVKDGKSVLDKLTTTTDYVIGQYADTVTGTDGITYRIGEKKVKNGQLVYEKYQKIFNGNLKDGDFEGVHTFDGIPENYGSLNLALQNVITYMKPIYDGSSKMTYSSEVNGTRLPIESLGDYQLILKQDGKEDILIDKNTLTKENIIELPSGEYKLYLKTNNEKKLYERQSQMFIDKETGSQLTTKLKVPVEISKDNDGNYDLGKITISKGKTTNEVKYINTIENEKNSNPLYKIEQGEIKNEIIFAKDNDNTVSFKISEPKVIVKGKKFNLAGSLTFNAQSLGSINNQFGFNSELTAEDIHETFGDNKFVTDVFDMDELFINNVDSDKYTYYLNGEELTPKNTTQFTESDEEKIKKALLEAMYSVNNFYYVTYGYNLTEIESYLKRSKGKKAFDFKTVEKPITEPEPEPEKEKDYYLSTKITPTVYQETKDGGKEEITGYKKDNLIKDLHVYLNDEKIEFGTVKEYTKKTTEANTSENLVYRINFFEPDYRYEIRGNRLQDSNKYSYKGKGFYALDKDNLEEYELVITLPYKDNGEVTPEPEPEPKNFFISTIVIPKVYKENKNGEYIEQSEEFSQEFTKEYKFNMVDKEVGINEPYSDMLTTTEKNPTKDITVKLLTPHEEYLYEIENTEINASNEFSYSNNKDYKTSSVSPYEYVVKIKIPYNAEGGDGGNGIEKPVIDFTDCKIDEKPEPENPEPKPEPENPETKPEPEPKPEPENPETKPDPKPEPENPEPKPEPKPEPENPESKPEPKPEPENPEPEPKPEPKPEPEDEDKPVVEEEDNNDGNKTNTNKPTVDKETNKPTVDNDVDDKPTFNKPLVNEIEADVNDDEEIKDLPKTGTESTNTLLYGLTILLMGGYILFTTRRNKTTKQ